MKAFVIAAETAKDEAMFAEYRKAVPATIYAFGGKFIVRGGNLTSLEGEWPHPRLVIEVRVGVEAQFGRAGAEAVRAFGGLTVVEQLLGEEAVGGHGIPFPWVDDQNSSPTGMIA